MYTVVSLLIENRIFLRSGVTGPRYIHHYHVDPWLTHSCKIYRLEQEAMGPFKDSIYATMPQGKIVNIDLETDVKHNEKDTDKKRNIITLNLFNYVKLHLTVVYYFNSCAFLENYYLFI